MELTPRLLTDVNFKEQWRGYSQNEVDEFLARIAAAVGELQQRLHEMTERASTAERKLVERSDADEIRRTLVLAERTATAAVDEAKAEAERIVSDARAAAGAAEAELGERRRAQQADIDALTAYASQLRDQLRIELQRMLATLDTPTDLPPPPVVEPEPAPAAAVEPDPYVPRPPTDDELAQARDDLVNALREAGLGQVFDQEGQPIAGEPTQAFDVLAEAAAAPDADPGDVPGLQWQQPEPEPEYAAPADEQPIEAEPAHDDDPFLAELRRAVTDDTPLGPRDHEHRPDTGDDDHDLPSSRFRLRRGR